MTLRPDLVLVALPPRGERVTRAGVVLLPRPSEVHDRYGLVLLTGEAVTSVRLHDRVIFDGFAAEEVTVEDWPCVIVPETALDAVME